MEMCWAHTKLQPYLHSKRHIISQSNYWPLTQAVHSWRVSSTMRERFWISLLRSLVKKRKWKCGICKQYWVRPLPNPRTFRKQGQRLLALWWWRNQCTTHAWKSQENPFEPLLRILLHETWSANIVAKTWEWKTWAALKNPEKDSKP